MQINTGASSGGEETSPDMLKNTASNIRRLAGEIEQHAGRQKYLAQTRSPSDGGDVRWYFCKVPMTVNDDRSLNLWVKKNCGCGFGDQKGYLRICGDMKNLIVICACNFAGLSRIYSEQTL